MRGSDHFAARLFRGTAVVATALLAVFDAAGCDATFFDRRPARAPDGGSLVDGGASDGGASDGGSLADGGPPADGGRPRDAGAPTP